MYQTHPQSSPTAKTPRIPNPVSRSLCIATQLASDLEYGTLRENHANHPETLQFNARSTQQYSKEPNPNHRVPIWQTIMSLY